MTPSKLAANRAEGRVKSDGASVLLPSQSIPPTKLYPPRLRPNYVSRTRLIDQLNEEADCRLTVVCAPAGYGKSTIVGQWLKQLSIPSVWVSPDREDNNLRSFCRLMVAALQTIDRHLVSATDALLTGAGTIADSPVLDNLIAELSNIEMPLRIVLDDFHTLDAPEIQRAVTRMLRQLPDSVRLVVISRSMPQLEIARLRANREISEIGPADLAFTLDETREFVQLRDLDLTTDQTEALLESTEGWVAALNLISLGLRTKPPERVHFDAERFSMSRRSHFDQYLWEEVLAVQPDEVQSFLLCTSILDRFTADLCNAVSQLSNCQELIHLCARDNLFVISLDHQDQWFRFHHLFSDLLRDKLSHSMSVESVAELHARASLWLEKEGLVEDAIRHAIAGSDWDRATSLLESVCSQLFDTHRLVELRDWLDELPREVLERSPMLAFYLAWARARLGLGVEAAEPLRIAQDAWTVSNDLRGLGLIQLWYGLRAMQAGDYLSAINHGWRASKLLSKKHPDEYALSLAVIGSSNLFHGNPREAERIYRELRSMDEIASRPLLQSMETVHAGVTLMVAGNLREATVLLRTAIEASEQQPNVLWMQAGYLFLGLNYLERGLLDEAYSVLQTADDLATAMQSLTWKPQIHEGLASVHWANRDPKSAFKAATNSLHFATQLGTRQEVRNARALEARFFIASHQLALAHRWADANVDDLSVALEYERQSEYMTYIRLLIEEGDAKQALRILSDLQRLAEVAGRKGDLVLFDILEALARKAGEDSGGALKALDRALSKAEESGHFQSFVNEGENLAPLLRHLAVRKGHREMVDCLLAAIEVVPSSPAHPDQSGLVEPLSSRELEVLQLVETGLANREIGIRLYISEKTVKKHLSNILGKLGAANRTQAVEQARRLNLI